MKYGIRRRVKAWLFREDTQAKEERAGVHRAYDANPVVGSDSMEHILRSCPEAILVVKIGNGYVMRYMHKGEDHARGMARVEAVYFAPSAEEIGKEIITIEARKKMGVEEEGNLSPAKYTTLPIQQAGQRISGGISGGPSRSSHTP